MANRTRRDTRRDEYPTPRRAAARRRKARRRALGALAILAIVLALASELHRSNTGLVTDTFTYASSALPAEFDGFTVALITDLHGSAPDALLPALRAAAPDLIAIGGDLVDDGCTFNALASLTAALPAIAPTYYVTGNHEWAAAHAEPLMKLLSAQGVTCLRNTSVALGRGEAQIVLAGIDDPNGYADQKTPDEVAQEVYDQWGDPFWILLAHRNDHYAEYAPLGSDLILTGHGHGGLIRLPFTDGLVGTERNLFPTWTHGFYTDYTAEFGSTLFVSRGMGNTGRTFRWGNPPQLALITLESEASS